MKAEYIDHMGDDLRVVDAARVSFNKESKLVGVPCPDAIKHKEEASPTCEDCSFELSVSDCKLIGYLARHGHWTPFAHPQITIRETVPIFVARQRFKHMIGFTYNEVSRRYVDDSPDFFRPKSWRSRPDDSIKQGSSELPVKYIVNNANGAVGSPEIEYENFLDNAIALYQDMLIAGVAPEQARMVLPQSMYTSYYVTGSLAAWARAYKQRIDPHAQKEIQDLAKDWGEIIEPLFPVCWTALTEE